MKIEWKAINPSSTVSITVKIEKNSLARTFVKDTTFKFTCLDEY